MDGWAMKQSHVTGLPFQHHQIGEISLAIVSRILIRFLYISRNSKKLGEKKHIIVSLLLVLLERMPLPDMIYIYYGSEMGTGEGFAEDLGKFLTEKGIKNTVLDIDEFEESEIVEQPLCIFFFSTYGNGVPTRLFFFLFEW